ncbi:MAG TPA: efflux RND transporter permease subunit [Candidatus Eremiobacteraceae bacterium]|nr:efflux RND transporter permease subunit [Candidatus Eremiobacteraceae bacterium]
MLTKLFVTRPTLAAVLVALITIGGLLAASSLRMQDLPNVDVPHIVVILFYPGASPAEMSDGVVRPIEDQLAGAPGLEHIQTRVQQGFATVLTEFSLHSKKTDALVEVQRRMQAVQAQLPADLPAPVIETFDPGESDIVSLSVASDTLSPGALSSLISNKIVPAIEQVNGVGNVESYGIVTPSIEVEVDPRKLQSAGLAINDVVGAIAGSNVRAPGGILFGDQRETGINIRGDITGAASVADLPIGSAPLTDSQFRALLNPSVPSPRLYKVADVAKVSDGNEPQRIYAYVNGKPTLLLNIKKETSASEIDTARGVLKMLPELQRQFPDVIITVINDQSSSTRQQVYGVMRTLIEGIILVAIVMVFFLRSWRNATAVLIAIPTSLFATLMVMQLGHFTLDTVSLLAMTLITGILVDDSIVVLENIQRHYEMGESPFLAAINGRLEISLAAIVITLVDVVVFLPIAFLPGIVGRFLSEFALVVVTATLASLVVSFTVTPALAGNWALLSKGRFISFTARFARFFERLRAWYADVALPWGLSHGGTVATIAVVSLVAALALIPLGVVGFEFDPAQDNGEIFVQIGYPSGTPLLKTRDTALAIEHEVDAIDDVRSEATMVGAAMSPVGGYLVDGAIAQIDIHLKDRRKHSTDYWVAKLRDIAQRLAAGAAPVVIPVTDRHSGNSQPLDYLVTDTSGDPSKYAQRVYELLRDTPGAVNVYSSAATLAPQLNVTFDRDLARGHNISLPAAATAIRAAFDGVRATQFEGPDGLKGVQVIYPPQYQRDKRQLLDVPLRTLTGEIVKIGDFARLDNSEGPRSIDRVDRQTVVHVSANVEPGVALSNVDSAFQRRVADLSLPVSVKVVPNSAGNQQNLSDTVNGMALAIVLGVVLVFLLMVALYNSYVTPFIIITSVPLAVVGAIGALALTRETLNAFSMIGTVLLIGLVSKNGILLVDFANQLRERGMDRLAAIRESARTRFRPIVMTTVAMIFGMLPLALGLDPAVASRSSLGVVVIGGLISSLLLTLVLIPVVYMWLSPKEIKVKGERVAAALRAVNDPDELDSSGTGAAR